MSIEYAPDHGYGLLLGGVSRDPAMTIGTAEELRSASDIAYRGPPSTVSRSARSFAECARLFVVE
ncbi:hypothetical protein [Streptomyces sp. NPDC058092]|uniref:hypothetical protein n=1 Tax=Streptomyces sp. NPDC058092 TaxID=3346336 RepID=UPI0036E5EE79